MDSIDLLKGKRLFRISRSLRERVYKTLYSVLSKDKRVVLAIVFGGFLYREYTRDIDVAVYLTGQGDVLEDYGYAEELSRKLSKEIGYPIDIAVLNHVNDTLFNTILLKGKPILIKNYRLYIGLKLLAHDQRTYFRKISKTLAKHGEPA